MKISSNKFLLTCFLAAALVVFFAACEKETDQMIPPILEFKTGAGYTSDSAVTVSVSTPIKVGIHAEKTEGDDYLHTFTVSHSYDGALPPLVDSMHVMEDSEHDIYETDVNFIARDIPGTEVWYFTISNRDGLVVTKTITLTVE